MESNISCSDEDADTGSRCGPGSFSMEMVSPPTVNVGGLAMPPTQTINQSAHPVNITRSSTSHLEYLSERFSGQGLSGQATELILKSWRTKTNKSYDSLFGR